MYIIIYTRYFFHDKESISPIYRLEKAEKKCFTVPLLLLEWKYKRSVFKSQSTKDKCLYSPFPARGLRSLTRKKFTYSLRIVSNTVNYIPWYIHLYSRRSHVFKLTILNKEMFVASLNTSTKLSSICSVDKSDRTRFYSVVPGCCGHEEEKRRIHGKKTEQPRRGTTILFDADS